MTDDNTQQDAADPSVDAALALMPAMGVLANTESARAIAQVQAAALLARTYPRDTNRAIEEILAACERPTLAAKATYVFRRGGEEITGPTIRLAEAIVQQWGNIRTGIDELSRDSEEGVSIVRAYAVDLQTGSEDERRFIVRHWRDVRNGMGYRVKTERDIREVIANYGQRNKRACIQTVVPEWVFEEAVEACEQTLYTNIRTDEQAVNDMLNSFAKIRIDRALIETRLGCELEKMLPSQMVELHKIFNSLRGQDSNASDWFAVVDAAEQAGAPTNTVADIVSRGQARNAVKERAPVKPKHVGDDIERQIREAKTRDDLNAATLRIGPLEDMELKGKLYDIGQTRLDEINAATTKGKK